MDYFRDPEKPLPLAIALKDFEHHISIPDQYLPVRNPSQITRCNHLVKLSRPHARTDIYLYSFFPWTIRQWNNLNISNLHQLNLQEFNNYLKNHSLESLWLCIVCYPCGGLLITIDGYSYIYGICIGRELCIYSSLITLDL